MPTITADSPYDFLITEPEGPAKAVFLFAHGSGGAMDSPFMTRMADMLIAQGIVVARFEFSYMARRRVDGKRRPSGRAERWVAHYARAVDELINGESWKDAWTGLPVLMGGKSMGGRVAVMAAEDAALRDSVAGVIVMGYPFHPIGKSEEADKWRLDALETAKLPILICQGERDDFGWWDEIDPLTLPEHVTLEWITDGSHDMGPTGKSEATLKSNMLHVADLAACFAENPPVMDLPEPVLEENLAEDDESDDGSMPD